LDIILAVGYRANSGRAIKFRQWATKTLRAHIVDGYTINKSRIAKNYDVFLKAVEQDGYRMNKIALDSPWCYDLGLVEKEGHLCYNTYRQAKSYFFANLPALTVR
jgi:hypothetical protein